MEEPTTAKRAQCYVKRPCRTLDSCALWDWLGSEHPETMAQFVIAFYRELVGHIQQGDASQCPTLREHIEKFVG